MQSLLTVVRALHFASLFALAGSLAFMALVAAPAFRRHPDAAGAEDFRRRLFRLAWLGLGLGVVSGLLWLLLEAKSMSGRPLADAFSGQLLGTVLNRTHFGHDWELRGALALPLVLVLLVAARRQAAVANAALWGALGLSAAEVATLAGAGHAAAGTGWAGSLQLVADGTHLLAAGAWVGGLAPLALLLAAARRNARSACGRAAYDATRRFSALGLIAVAAILATGLVNSLFLVGTVPALLGTDYGHWLMIKVALFAVMAILAAINRFWHLPQLAGKAAPAAALRRLQRNALVEVGLGGAVLLVLGALGTMPPALHSEPRWPLPYRLSLAAIEASPQLRIEALAALAVALLGLAALGYALVRPSQRMALLIAGGFIFLTVGWWPLQFMLVAAYPTSFARSPVPFAAASILRGARVYGENCVACHGAGGRGDGPLAKGLAVAPADLTAEHIFGHSDGDLFWWISRGIPTGPMPGFAASVSAQGRWDLINFIRARAGAAQPSALLPGVTAGPAPLAPDFAFERGGRQGTLREALATGPVLLVLYRLPGALARLRQLAGQEHRLAAAGLRLLAIPIDPAAAETDAAGPLPDFAASAEPDAAAAYALFTGGDHPGDCEFLIGGAGFLRARWRDAPPDEAALLTALGRLAALPMHARPAHVHAH